MRSCKKLKKEEEEVHFLKQEKHAHVLKREGSHALRENFVTIISLHIAALRK
jgi:hypothetical protein